MRTPKQDQRVWLGLVLALVGVFVLDRSFALWRNDARNFAHWDGSYLTDAQLISLRTPPNAAERPFQEHRVLVPFAVAGFGCMVASLVLLGRLDRLGT